MKRFFKLYNSTSTKGKTTVLLLLAFLTIISLFSGFIFLSLSKYTTDDFEKILEIRAITTANAELGGKDNIIAQELRNVFFGSLPGEKDFIIPYSENIDSLINNYKPDLPKKFYDEVITKGSADHIKNHIYYKGILYEAGNEKFIVIASAENYFELHHSIYLKRTMIISAFAACVFFLIISYYISHLVFDPIRKMTFKVKDISSEKLHLRLEDQYKSLELSELALTFNNMLDRLETSFETQNNFISNASHELRTPLTAIIGEADVTLSKLRKPEEYIETLQVILDEAEKLDQKTKALLFLAQTGYSNNIPISGKVRVDQLLYDVKETIEKLNNKNKLHIDLSMLPENPIKLKVHGNEQLLHLAFTNIISNGCKYSNFQTVIVSIGSTNTHVIIIVKDQGIGIPANELDFIYDPFFRASNTKNYEGYGIGMPLSRNIIRVHGGQMIVNSIENKGTTVQIKLPIGYFGYFDH